MVGAWPNMQPVTVFIMILHVNTSTENAKVVTSIEVTLEAAPVTLSCIFVPPTQHIHMSVAVCGKYRTAATGKLLKHSNYLGLCKNPSNVWDFTRGVWLMFAKPFPPPLTGKVVEQSVS